MSNDDEARYKEILFNNFLIYYPILVLSEIKLIQYFFISEQGINAEIHPIPQNTSQFVGIK